MENKATSSEGSCVKGRFAPSPSGRMHLGNVFTALISWLSVKSRGGKWILRIEDLDPQRSRPEYARLIEDDLLWLGLEWDEGGIDCRGEHGPYLQSHRYDIYNDVFEELVETGLLYPCHCTRADIMATQAPHQSDGRIVYPGTCRPCANPPFPEFDTAVRAAVRLFVDDRDIEFDDRIFGHQQINLSRHCGDFVLRRADGAWAYQLAVVVDDALMGVTEVVRGCDLLASAAQQIYLYRLLGFAEPVFAHVPLLCNQAGQRLSKRDSSMSLGEIRKHHSPDEVIAFLAHAAGIIDEPTPVSAEALIDRFDCKKIAPKLSLVI